MLQMNSLEAFLDSLVARDFQRLATLLAPDVRARLLLPRGPEEQLGREAVSRRMDGWFGAASRFEVLAIDHEAIGHRQRARWRFRVQRGADTWEVIEQIAFLDFGPDGVERLDLICSGFLAEHVFDAGDLGCADGLAGEFRARLSELAEGESLSCIVADPAAREDLPALARLLGQSVTSIEATADGRFAINVRRSR